MLKTLKVSRDIAAIMEFVLEEKLLIDLEPMLWSVNVFSLVEFENTRESCPRCGNGQIWRSRKYNLRLRRGPDRWDLRHHGCFNIATEMSRMWYWSVRELSKVESNRSISDQHLFFCEHLPSLAAVHKLCLEVNHISMLSMSRTSCFMSSPE